MGLSDDDKREAEKLMIGSPMFKYCSSASLKLLASKLEMFKFLRGEKLLEQGIPCDYMFVLSSGDITRTREESGVEHQVDPGENNSTINTMHALRGDPPYATAVCQSDVCKAYALSQMQFRELLTSDGQLSTEVITSLQKELREQKNAFRTPFLELKNRKDINVPAVAMAAAIESYYRSALNAILNARLLGQKGALFPNMHIQVPARALYINGFKGMRAYFDRNVRPEEYSNPTLIRYAAAVGPGLVMNPVSSVLEASNAGVVSGYLSHVPHNLSAYKLMEPHKTYGEHFRKFVDTSVPENLVPENLPPRLRSMMRTTLAVLFPRGCVIRTTQIVGSFMILNGTIGYLARLDQERINRAFGETSSVPVVE